MKKRPKLQAAILAALASSSYADDKDDNCFDYNKSLPKVLECFQNRLDTQRLQLDTQQKRIAELEKENQSLRQQTGTFTVSIDNVGIGTTSSGATLHVNGTIKVFGAWENKAVNTVYQASTDGFVVVNLIMPSGSGRSCAAQGFTDSKSSPATLRISASVVDNGGYGYSWPQYGGFNMPVRKGNYWKVTTRGNVCSGAFVNWMPLGN